jgi:putative ABC transport system permease protein
MFRATMRSLAAHKVRLALTAMAIVLGVAFMAGTFVLTDTVKHSFDSLFQQVNAGKDIVVQGVAPYGTGGRGGFGGGQRVPVPDSLVPTVRAVPGVADAQPAVQGIVTLIGPNGKAVTHRGPPTLAFNWNPNPKLSSLHIIAGHAPEADDQVVIDRSTVDKQHWSVGTKVTVITNQPPQQFTLVGISKFGSQNSLLGATLVSFTLNASEHLFGTPGFVQQISVAVQSGHSTDTVLNAVSGVLPNNVEAVTGATAAQQQASAVNSFVNIFNTFLLVFAGIALFVGAFLIANTFSILIGQRTRELALLRAVGASRAQVTRSMLGEAFATGLVGSAIGLALGVPLAIGLQALLRAFGFGPPASGIVFLPRTVIVSLVVGTGITLISAIGPARRASRIPPVAAMRDDATAVETSMRRRAIVGGLFAVVGIVLLVAGLFGHVKSPLPLVGAGAALTFIGVATLSAFVAGGLSRAIGAPIAKLRGVTGRLAEENAARNPRRTAATASALMVGLALVAAIATLGASINSSFSAIIDRSITASYVISSSSNSNDGFSRAVEPTIKSAPGVVAMSPWIQEDWHQGHTAKQVIGIDPAAGPQVFTIKMVNGSYGTLAQGQLLVDDKVFHNDHFHLGELIPMGFVDSGVTNVPIGGTFKTNQFLGNYVVSDAFLASKVNQLLNQAIFVKTSEQTPEQQAALTSALHAYPNLKVQTAAQFKADQKKQFGALLNFVYVLLALSIIIASFSVVNTMALSVIERTREIGLLRSIGMLRKQVRAMVRGEAVIVSLLGAVIGLVIGVLLGAAIVHAASSSGISVISIPVPTIIVVLILAALIGVFAAVWPARRAARLDILQAIATA